MERLMLLRNEDHCIPKRVLGGSFKGKGLVGRPHSRLYSVQESALILLI
jgi:hypothetical protein